MQRAAPRRRLMVHVAKPDVIVTNPTHKYVGVD
ncbi:EscU/YscU/HrcU family type III secretion system export apparatus switch protein [Enterobacter hormaechei]